MKNILFILCVYISVMLSSCDTREIPLFDEENELYFDLPFVNTPRDDADTIIVSFFFFKESVTQLEVNLNVKLSGNLLTAPLSYELEKIPLETSLSEDNFKLEEKYIFPANVVDDTISFQVFKTEALKNKIDVLTLTFKTGGFFGLGQSEYAKRVILVTSLAVRPVWWDTDFSYSLLGVFSEKKLRLFVDLVADDVPDILHFDELDPAIQRKAALKFKYWLEAEELAGRTVYEENGEKMTVQVIG